MTQNMNDTNHTPTSLDSAPKDKWYAVDRLGGLRRFALAITLLNILGHTWLGFEQSWLHPIVAVLTAYAVELLFETINSLTSGRKPRYAGGVRQFIDFLLPGHISGLAVSMLLYPGDRLMPIALAAAVAMASKQIFRITVGGRGRHFLNPSNFGITVTLVLFPWVGIAPPYHFTENLSGIGNWIFPIIIICSGTFLNTRFTRRLPLIASWLAAFVVQGVIRASLFDTPIAAALMPMTGVAFLLFTFYMVTDPPTSPSKTKNQIAFAVSVAALYSVLMMMQVVFGLFFALTIVCSVRGVYMYAASLQEQRSEESEAKPVTLQGVAPVSQAPEIVPEPAMLGRVDQ